MRAHARRAKPNGKRPKRKRTGITVADVVPGLPMFVWEVEGEARVFNVGPSGYMPNGGERLALVVKP